MGIISCFAMTLIIGCSNQVGGADSGSNKGDDYVLTIKDYGPGISVYSETHTNESVWTHGLAFWIWEKTATVAEMSDGAPEGSHYWQWTVNANWMGMEFTYTNGDGSAATIDMTAYTNGHLVFLAKSLKAFEIVIHDYTNSSGSVNIFYPELQTYGFTNDNRWHQVVIPCKRFTGINFAKMHDTPLVMHDGASDGWGGQIKAGDVFCFDDMYFSLD